MFNEKKVSQMAAYLLKKGGETYAHLKLMKLLYLSDRESMDKFGFPISGDSPVSMPHGPVLSQTLSLISGDVLSNEGGWEYWISDKANHTVSLKRQFTRNDLDELSDAEIEILDNIWSQFGAMDKWTIRDYTHTNCPEWEDPKGSSYPIDLKRIFLALGKTEDQASSLKAGIEEQRSINELFASL